MGAFDDLIPQSNAGSGAFDDLIPAAKPKKKRGVTDVMADMGTALWEGAKSTGRMVGASGNTFTGDLRDVEDYALRQQLAQESRPEAVKALTAEIERRKQANPDGGVVDAIRDVGGAMIDNPEGSAQFVIEQAPNSAVALGAGFAGAKLGAAGGSVFGPVGAAVGGIGGFLGGMFLGNTLLETGGKAIEKAEGGFTEAERGEAIREGAVKGGVITAVDAATLGAGNLVSKSLGRAAINAGARAEARVLADAGVDLTSRAAIEAALTKNPALRQAAKTAGEAAAKAASTAGSKAGMAGTGLVMETAGEGTGEYLGELAATGKADVYDAVMEAAAGFSQSVPEVAWNMRQASSNDLNAKNIQRQGADLQGTPPGAPPAPPPATSGAAATPNAPTAADPSARLAELEILAEQRDLTPAERQEAVDLLTALSQQDEQDAPQGTEPEAAEAAPVEAAAPEGSDGAAVAGVPAEPATPDVEAAGVAPEVSQPAQPATTGEAEPSRPTQVAPPQPAPTDFWSFARSRGYTPSQVQVGSTLHAALKAEYDAQKLGSREPILPPMQPQQDVNLQNRDRGRAASVVQMADIARNPDYMRLGPSRTPDSGAPMVFAVGDQINIDPQAFGRQDVAVMSDGQRVPFRYAVVDASRVNPSNFADGRQNPEFNSTTPGTLKALNNGRTAGVRAAHEMGTAGEYVSGLQADEAMHGIPADVIARTPNPMLVRVYSDADNTAGMAAKSQGQGLGMSPAELARQDAPLMDSSVLGIYQPGDVTSAGNRDFVRAFIGKLQGAGQDVAGMMTGDGQLSQDGRKRIQAALMQAAYGDSDIVEEMFDSTDTDIKAIGEALKTVAGQWANMRDSAKLGAINPRADITQNLIQAIGLIRKARRDNTMVYDLVQQPDLMTGETPDATTVGVLRMFYSGQYMTRAVGKDRLTQSLADYVTRAMVTTPDAGLFGEVVTPGEILATISATEGQGNAETESREGRGQPVGGDVAGVGADEVQQGDGGPGADGSRAGPDQDSRSQPGQDAPAEAQQQVGAGDQTAEESNGPAAERADAGQQEDTGQQAAPARGRAGAPDGEGLSDWQEHRRIEAQLDVAMRGTDVQKQLDLVRKKDAAVARLIEAGATQDEIGANALGVSVEHFRDLVKAGTYSREYGAADSLFPTKPKRARKAKGEAVKPKKATKPAGTDAELERQIQLAADSIRELRKVDVDRVLTQDGIDPVALGDYIKRKRPELTAEVDEVLAEIAGESQSAEPLLTAPTAEEVVARQDAAEAAQREAEAADRAAQRQAEQDEDRKRIAQASVAAADTFELGQDPLDSLTGQTPMFSRSGGGLIQKLKALVAAAMAKGNENQTVVLSPVSEEEVALLQREGVPVESGFVHTADMFAVRHAITRHGDEKTEAKQGQLPLTEEDIAALPQIIEEPDALLLGAKTKRGQDIVGSLKRLPDGTVLYLEEVRSGRKTLAMTSMRKYPGTTDFETIKNRIVPSYAQSDTGDVRIIYPDGEAGQGVNFSRAKAKEIRNLVTLHNLTEANLEYADSMGGMPVPSLGITKVDAPFSGFGNITLVGDKNLVDPSQGVPVFDRDAWTARFPSMNFKKPKKAKADAFYERMKAMTKGIGVDEGSFLGNLWESMVNASVTSPDKVADHFQRYDAPRLAYARDVLERPIKVPMRAARLSSPAATDKQLQAYWKKNGGRLLELERELSGYDFSNTPEYKSFMAEIEGAVRRYAEASGKADRADSYVNMFLPDGQLGSGGFNNLRKDFEKAGTKEIDGLKLRDAVRKVVPDNDPAYLKWVQNQVKPLFDAPTITLRGREVAPTLDNIVEAMTVGATAGVEKSMTFGPGKLAAHLGKRFKSLDEIKAARDQVVSESVESEAKKATDAILEEFRTHVAQFFKFKDFKGVDQRAIDLARQAIEGIRNTATNYFEAKPQRAVKLNEFKGAVVPKGIAAESLAILEKNGITVEFYGKTEGAREKAIEKLAKRLDRQSGDVLFSFAGEKSLTHDDLNLAFAQDMVARGQDPEKVRQETGWFQGKDGKWRYEISDKEAFTKGTGTFGEVIMRWYNAGVERTGNQLYRTTVGDMLYHPKLFAAYPALAQIEVQMMPARVKSQGRVMRTVIDGEVVENVIQIQEDLPADKWLSVLLHELQHGIQYIEGFAAGGSPSNFAKDLPDGSYDNGFETYKRTGGEVEARNTQARQGMTDEQRRATPPSATQDVPDADVIVMFDGKVAENAPMPANIRRPGTMTETTVRQVADTIAARWTQAPTIVVVPNMQDMRVPEAARLEDARQRAAGATGVPRGFYHRGTVYLVADGLKSVSDAAEALFHEALGHYGLRAVFGAELLPILDQIAMARPDLMRKKAEEYGKDLKVLKQRREVAEEVLAEMAQTKPNIGFVKRAIAAIRTWLRQNVPALKDMALTDAEIIQNYILPARGWVERGERAMRPGGQVALDRGGEQAFADIAAHFERYPSRPPAGMTNDEAKAYLRDRRASMEALVDAYAPRAEGLLMPVRGNGGFWGVTREARPDGDEWRVTRFDRNMEPQGHEAHRSARDAVADVLNWVDVGRLSQASMFSRTAQTLTEAFRRWFKDSKVRVPMTSSKQKFTDMPPLVVYHATNADIAVFESGRETVNSTTFGDDVTERHAIFFAEDPSFAEAYIRRGGGGNVMPVYLSIQNPLYLGEGISGEDLSAIMEQADRSKMTERDFYYINAHDWWSVFDGDFGKEFVRAARAAGFDGAQIVERDPDGKRDGYFDVWVAFDPAQIKSATGNRGTFDPTNPDIRFSRSAQVNSQALANVAELPAETLPQYLQRRVQDKLNRFTVIKEWLATQGVNLSEGADVYKAEERMHARYANKAQDFREKRLNPLIQKTQKAGFTLDEVAQFLHAQHAEERNKQVAKVNKDRPDGGSGMTTAEANKILAAAPAELKVIANEFREIAEDTKKTLLKAGIIAQDTVDAWEGAYKHYVPLKGGPDGVAGNGKGLSVSNKQKRALGHDMREEGEWILENIVADYERALMAAEKNRVGIHLIKMAAEAGRDDLITIGKPKKRQVLKNQTAYVVEKNGVQFGVYQTEEAAKMARTLAGVTGVTITRTTEPSVVLMATPQLQDNEVNVYLRGMEVRLQINDELLARAYRNMGDEALGAVMSAGRALNAYFSKIYTGYNPEFIQVNLIRDFATGLINVTGEEGFGMAVKAARNYPKRFAELFRYARTNEETKWVKMYREDGGNTGAAYLSDMERLGSDIATEYAVYQGFRKNLDDMRAAKTGKDKMKAAWLAARAAGRKVFDKTLVWVERLNQAGENAMRLAVYQAMIESGRSRSEAGSLAKNSTVNFNRKGELGKQANALYLFFNAGVQGTAAIARAHMRGKYKGQARALSASLVALGYLASLLAASGDEDEYEEISEFERTRNMLIPTGDGFVKIPVPYGYGFFFNAGRGLADAQRAGEVGKLPWHLATSMIEEFTPFGNMVAGGEPDGKQAFIYAMPTAGQIVGAPLLNQTGMGGPMMPESAFDPHQPDREKMWRQTRGSMADTIAGALYAAGLDVSPETLRHYGRTFTGGAGTFLTSVGDGMYLTLSGAELETSEIPFLRRMYMVPDVRGARARYNDAKHDVSKYLSQYRRAIKAENFDLADQIATDNREMIQAARMAQGFSRVVSAQRDMIDNIRIKGNYTKAEERALVKQLEAEERELYRQFMDELRALRLERDERVGAAR